MRHENTPVYRLLPLMLAAGLLAACGGGGGGGGGGPAPSGNAVKPPLRVNSLEDLADPPQGTVTFRSALAAAASGQAITFDPSLDGAVISLSIVAEEHTVLKGEVMGMRDEPSGPVSYLVGYFDRDYGRSALVAEGNVIIDASALPSGITLAWTGGDADPARVLAVRGDLDMTNVTVTGGRSVAVDIRTEDPASQPWTLARGAGVAVWGRARLRGCTLHDNHCTGDFESSRDRGAFGGGLYADVVDLDDCVIGGNTVVGGGAAGGGVYCVGGAGVEGRTVSTLDRCSVTGNRIRALFTYGGGVYSDGGGIGKSNTLELTNCTVARNLVDPAPGLPPFVLKMGYWRGGGIYVSNGNLTLACCTVVENEVRGYPRTDSLGRRNLAGGIAATVGNAHAVEAMRIGQCILAGNVVRELGPGGVTAASRDHDVFTGSLIAFRSRGHNRIGTIDFTNLLVPVGEWGWHSLCRKHYPKVGDRDGVALGDAVDAGGIVLSGTVLSRGVGEGAPAPLLYAPGASSLDQVPAESWPVEEVRAQFHRHNSGEAVLLPLVLSRIEECYGLPGFAAGFTADFEAHLAAVDTDAGTPGLQPHADPGGAPILTLADTRWFGPAVTWPRETSNYAYIEFWHLLDEVVAAEIPGMGPERLGDDAWGAMFPPDYLEGHPDAGLQVNRVETWEPVQAIDQAGTARPAGDLGDVGAVEKP